MDAEAIARKAVEGADIEGSAPIVLTASWSEDSQEIRVMWQGSFNSLSHDDWGEIMGCLIDFTAEEAGLHPEQVGTLFEWEHD